MKIFLFITAICFSWNLSISQSRMIMTVNGKQDNILGYTIDPDGTSNKQSISLFGSMPNSITVFHFSYSGGSPIGTVVISITDANTIGETITLTGVTVYALKEYISNYSNGIFSISPTGIANTELKCKFQKIEIKQDGSNSVPIKELKNTMPETQTTWAWDMQTDSSLSGATGQLIFQMPTNISYAHLKVFKSGEAKVAASLYGNSKSNLLPGNYDLLLEKYSIKNVPIEVGKTTRLKIGILIYSPRGSVSIVDINKQEFSMAGPFKIPLPAGTYYIDGKKEHSFIIKDGGITEY